MADLFSEIQIGNLTLKNRVAFAPIENGYANAGGIITERLIRFFEKCAENECGLVFTGSVAVDFDGKGVPSQLEIFDETRLPGLRELVERLHKKGCKAATQLYHAGRQIGHDNLFTPIAPSPVNCKLFENLAPPKEMDKADLERIREKFRISTKRALDMGFDLIEIHFAHGYLLHSFLSPYSNQRTDEYGGSPENRMRYPLEILKTVIEEVNGKVPVGVRLSVEEYLEGGLGFEEAIDICKAVQAAGADVLSVSAGSYDSMEYMIQPMHVPAGFLRGYARKLKEILSIPVMVAGRLNTAELIRDVIEKDDADIVAVGRGFIADPEVIRKIKENRDEEIRCCTGCNQGCLGRIFICKDVKCIFNPQTGFEGIREIEKTENSKKIGIIGAGIAGLNLARFLAEAGHEVTIFDEHIGGKLRAMSVPRDRENFALPILEGKQMLKRLNVKWIQKKVSSGKELEEYGFEQVFVATGSIQDKIKAEKVPVVEASEALLAIPAENRIAVAGGGYIGLEAARHLAMLHKDVTVFEESETIGLGVGDTVINRMKEEIDTLGIKIYTNHRIDSEKDILKVCPDTEVIVQSFGYVKNRTMPEAFEKAVFVGSVKEAMSILECSEDAWKAYETYEKG